MMSCCSPLLLVRSGRRMGEVGRQNTQWGGMAVACQTFCSDGLMGRAQEMPGWVLATWRQAQTVTAAGGEGHAAA